MKNKSLGINALLNAFKSALSIIFPLITYPYVFRILHASGIGKVNYSSSIVNYFSLIAALGISTYAVREGAKLKTDKKKFDEFCSQMFSLNVITTAISYILLFIVLFFSKSLIPYKAIILLLSITIAFSAWSLEWINTIFEDYLFITLRSILINVISFILLFLFVRTEKDYIAYTFLTVLTSGCICFSNWFYCRKYVRIRFTKNIKIKKHIKPILIFFANNIATSIYVSADVTMLGFLIGDSAVGLYSLAVKIYNVIKAMLAALYSVAVPRLAYYVGQNDKKNIKKTITSLFSNLVIILLPVTVGLISISREIILFMGGEDYISATLTLQILAIALIFAIIGGALTYCLIVPLGREKITVKATIYSATINIILNFLAIPLFSQNGAAITTTISEIFVAMYCIVKFPDIKSYIDINILLRGIRDALIGCISIIIISFLVNFISFSLFFKVSVIFIMSAIIYTCELIILKNPMAISLLSKFFDE